MKKGKLSPALLFCIGLSSPFVSDVVQAWINTARSVLVSLRVRHDESYLAISSPSFSGLPTLM